MLIAFLLIAVGAIWILSSALSRINQPSPVAAATNAPYVEPATQAPQPAKTNNVASNYGATNLDPLPTATTAPSNTPAPVMPAKKDLYLQDETAHLRENVTITLLPDFVNEGFVGCWPQKPGFAVTLRLQNMVSKEFVARFDRFGFSAKDDLGNSYTLKESGFNCETTPGIVTSSLDAGYHYDLYLSFTGQIPLEAKYIVITVNDISGSGTLVFRKDL
jgi:hypothetical protein